MAAPKRTSRQKLADQATVASLYVRGHSHAAIARHMQGLYDADNDPVEYTLKMVSRDIMATRKAWLDSQVRDFDAAKAEQLARLDEAERQAWEQWERSCGKVEKRTEGLMAAGNVDYTVTQDQCGDPRYLTVILGIIDRRCQILGLDAPKKVAPTEPDGVTPWQPMTSEEADARILELVQKLGYVPGPGERIQ